ncbi:MAG: hypothetical protein P8K79_08060 [Mariniblastus sp.]|nr:hypothetical protein [Mariniblastus sp.]
MSTVRSSIETKQNRAADTLTSNPAAKGARQARDHLPADIF